MTSVTTSSIPDALSQPASTITVIYDDGNSEMPSSQASQAI